MIINLTIHEILYIDDSLTLSKAPQILSSDNTLETVQESSMRNVGAAIVSSKDTLIEKIVLAVARWVDEGEKIDFEAALEITREEFWILRELATSTAELGDHKVGLGIKKKISSAYRNDVLNLPVLSEVLKDFTFSTQKDVEYKAEEPKRKVRKNATSTNKNSD